MRGLPKILRDKIKANGCYSRDFLRSIAKDNGYDVSTCDRKLRLLTQQGYIKPEEEKGFIVRYYWIEQKKKRVKKPEPVLQDSLF